MFGPTLAREQALHAEEVRVEDRGEERLVDGDLVRQREDAGRGPLRGHVEVAGEVDEPVVARDRGDAADAEGAEGPAGVVVRDEAARRRVRVLAPRLYVLPRGVAEEVDDERGEELRDVGTVARGAIVGSEGAADGSERGPEPGGTRDGEGARTGGWGGGGGSGGGICDASARFGFTGCVPVRDTRVAGGVPSRSKADGCP